ncbi:MAG TPA: autotransporter-associated beta strand repeat-containing protein, partial [Tepidisphaeraceae bacterium]
MAWRPQKFGWVGWAFNLIAKQRGRARRWARRRLVRKSRGRREQVRPISLRALETLEGRAFFSVSTGTTYDVSLVDKSLPQSKLLIRGAAEHTRVITFDSRSESTAQVLQRVIDLGEHTRGARIRALSVFSHGTRGRFALGEEWVSDETLDDTAGRWRKLRGVLAVDAAVQLFSCETAAGADGQVLLGRLSSLTGATVFGSTDVTGMGGDWELEAVSRAGVTVGGQATRPGLFSEARVPLNAEVQNQYEGTLSWIGATTGSTNDAAHDYNNTANWAGGVIDDSFNGVTLTANTTLYLSANRTTGAAGLDLNYNGAFDLTIQSNSVTTRTLTLGTGGIFGSFGGGNSRMVTIGNVTNAVNVSMGGGTPTMTVTDEFDTLVIKNVLSNGSLIKAGAGNLTLIGANTYAGGTTVSDGTLNVGDHTSPGSNPYTNTALGSGAVTVSNAILNLDTQASGGSVYVITIANNILLNGSATLKSTEGENHLTGTLTITGTSNSIQPRTSNKAIAIDGAITGSGSVDITGINNAFSPGNVQINSSNNTGFTGTLTVNGATNVGVQLAIASNTSLVNATVVVNGPIPATVSANSVYTQKTSPLIFLTGVTAAQLGMLGGTGDIALLTNTASAAVALTVGANNTNNTYSGVLSGTGSSLTKTGTGALALGGANTFTGGIMLSAGTLNLNHAAAVGTGGLTIAAGSTIDNTSGGAITLNNNLQTWSGSFAYGGTDDLTLGTGAITIGGSRTITTNGSATLTVNGVVTGAIALTKAGAGRLTLSGANTYSGGTTLSAGTLNINHASALGTGTFAVNGGTIDNTSGAAITLTANNAQTWGGDFTFAGTNALNLGAGAITLSAARQVTVTAGTLTAGGAVAGAFGLTKAGTGTLVLQGSSTYSGGTTVNAGTLQVGNGINPGSNPYANTMLGTGAVVINSGGTLSFYTQGGGGTVYVNNFANNFTLNGNATLANFEGTNSLNGTVTITGTGNAIQAAYPNKHLIIGGTLTGSGAVTLTNLANGLGPGVVRINSTNNTGYTGTITLNETTNRGVNFVIGSNTALVNATVAISGTFSGTGSNFNFGSSALIFASGVTAPTIGMVTGSGSVILETQDGTALPVALTVGGNNTSGTFSGVFSDGGIGGSLTMNGTGALTLTGANTHAGGTTLTAGTLNIGHASAVGTGTFAINGGTINNTSGSAITLANNNAQTWGGNFTFTGTSDLNLGTGAVTMAAARTLTLTAGNLTVGGNIAGGANTLTTNASGRLILSGNNTLGAVTIGNGTGNAVLRATTSTALGSGVVTITGGTPYATLELVGGITLANALSIPGRLTGTTGIRSVSGNNVLTGAITLTTGGTYYPMEADAGAGLTLSNASLIAAAPGGSRILQLKGAGTGTISGAIGNGSGAVGVNVLSTGTWTLSGASTFSGGTTLDTGTLNINNASAVGTGTFTLNGGTIDNTSGGTITLVNNNAQTWGGNFTFTGTNALNLGTGAVTLTAARQITTTASTLTVGGNIGDGGSAYSITKAGAGTLALGGTSTYSGGTTASAGTLEGYNASGSTSVATPAMFGSTSSTVTVATGATVWLRYSVGASNNTVTYANNFSGAGTLKVTAPGSTASSTAELSGNLSGITGVIDLFPNSASNGKVALVNASAGAVPSASATIKVESGVTLFVWRGFTYASNIQIYGTGNSEGLGTLRIESGTVISGTVTLMVNGSVGSNVGTGNITGVISDGGNGYSLTKVGSATIALSGANTYSGSTSLSTGTLRINNTTGSGAGSGSITVASGTTLGGTGGVTGAISVQSGGTFAPGAPGASAFASGAITVASGGTYSVDVNSSTSGTGYDKLNVTGTVNLTGSTLSTAGTRTVTGGDTIVLIDNDGSDAVVGTFSGLAQGAAVSVNGVAYTLSYTGGTGNDVVLTDVAPTVATAASATPSPVTGTTTALSVLGASSAGESTLTYTWAATAKPAGSTPTFGANGTNAAKASTVTFDKVGSYTFTVTISNGTDSTTSAVTVVVNQTLTTITVSPPSASLNQNGTQQFTAVGYDQFGLAMASQPTFTWAKQSGVGSVSGTGLYTAPGSGSGSAVVSAASGGVTGTASVTVTNAAPTVATPASATPSPVTGTTTTLTALGADDNGEANLIYTWSATAKPAGSTPAFSANGTNAAKSSLVTFDKAGSYTFQVTISDGTSSVTSNVTVIVNQTLTSIAVTPASTSLNLNGTQQFTAVGYDQFSVAMGTQPTFTWSKTAGVGSIDAAGLYTSTTAGSATVQAASGGVTATATVSVSDAAPTIATPASAAPSLITATTTTLTALGADDGGEANLTYTWTATTKPAGSTPTFGTNGTNAAKSSLVTFDKSGSYTFQVTINDGTGSVTSSVTVVVNQTLSTITVSPASASLNLNGTQQFTAVGYDQFGLAMASQPAFMWAKQSGVGSIDTAGLYTAGATAGTAVVAASSGGVTGTAGVTVTNAAPTVATPAAATASPVTTATLTVLGADDNGEANLTYTWAATTKPAGSTPTFGTNGTNAAKSSVVTFDKAGSYTFQVTISDGTSSVTSSVVVTVNQTLSSIAVSPASTALNLNGTQPFSAVGYDQFGVALSSQPSFTWSKTSGVGSIDSTTGLYTAPAATGVATVAATSGGVSGTASVTVSNAAPTVATPASATPSPVTGTTTTLTALGADDNGEGNLTYTWAATAQPAGSTPMFGTNAAKSSVVTFDKSGSYTFQVTIGDGTSSVTSAVTVVVSQTLTTIAVSPASASLNQNGTQQFTAVGYDQFGVAMSSQPTFTWAKQSGVGGIDAAGLYTAPGSGSGSAVVSAASGGVTGTAGITVTNAAPTVATPAAATPSPVTGTTTTLTALGADDGGEANLTYTWTATAKPAGSTPTFGTNGTNAAKSSVVTFDKGGSYTFQVTISDGTGSVTSSVTVVVNQTLSTITVSPSSASLNLNGTQQFTAVGYDQFGVAMGTQPSFTWSVISGVGSIDTAGLYTTGATAGSATVEAASGGVAGTASVAVANAAPTVAT